MVVWTLDAQKDSFCPLGEVKIILSPEMPYLSTIGVLMYFENNTKPYIPFVVNLLARYGSTSTRRHWKGIKDVLYYLYGTTYMGLFYPQKSSSNLMGFADAEYWSDPHRRQSQTGYIFSYNGTTIS